METQKRHAFIYLRISQDRSGSGLGVARQRQRCEELAASHDLEVTEVFTDNDVSAYSGKRRPAYQELVSRLSEVDYVIAWSTDRLFRIPIEMEQYAKTCEELDVLTLTVDDGSVDLSTSNGRFYARVYAAIASRESEHKAERIKLKSQQTIRAGRHTGGARPFGYDLVRTEDEKAQKLGARYEVNEAEAELIRQAAEDILNGRSMHSIVRDWNDENRPGGAVLTTLGNTWKQQTLRQLLLKPRYVGDVTYKGKVLDDVNTPAILPRHVWEAVKRKLIANSENLPSSHTNKARYLVPGIARCECGDYVKTGTARGREIDPETGKYVLHVLYRCRTPGAGHVNKRASHVDKLVRTTASFVYYELRVNPPNQLTPEDQARIRTLETERVALVERRAGLADRVVSGDIPVRLVGEIERKAVVRMEDIDNELAELASPTTTQLNVRTRLQHLDRHRDDFSKLHIDDQRDFIRQTMRITLLRHVHGSARFFDPDSVKIESLVPSFEGPAGTRLQPYIEELSGPEHLQERIREYKGL